LDGKAAESISESRVWTHTKAQIQCCSASIQFGNQHAKGACLHNNGINHFQGKITKKNDL
jgi:hypothetical protein